MVDIKIVNSNPPPLKTAIFTSSSFSARITATFLSSLSTLFTDFTVHYSNMSSDLTQLISKKMMDVHRTCVLVGGSVGERSTIFETMLMFGRLNSDLKQRPAYIVDAMRGTATPLRLLTTSPYDLDGDFNIDSSEPATKEPETAGTDTVMDPPDVTSSDAMADRPNMLKNVLRALKGRAHASVVIVDQVSPADLADPKVLELLKGCEEDMHVVWLGFSDLMTPIPAPVARHIGAWVLLGITSLGEKGSAAYNAFKRQFFSEELEDSKFFNVGRSEFVQSYEGKRASFLACEEALHLFALLRRKNGSDSEACFWVADKQDKLPVKKPAGGKDDSDDDNSPSIRVSGGSSSAAEFLSFLSRLRS